MIVITVDFRGGRYADKKTFSSAVARASSRGKVAAMSPVSVAAASVDSGPGGCFRGGVS